MGTFILVTVGTSLPGHLKRDLGTPGLPLQDEAFALLEKQDPCARSMGAEINATEQLLRGLNLSTGETDPPFELCFIVSETPEGRWTGELLTRYYREVRGIEKSQWKEIEGLCPSFPDRFTRVGLRSLILESARLLREAASRGIRCVINATGGFKAQISLAGLIGQTIGVPVVYQFDGFSGCIEMPAIPLEIDKEVWFTNYDLFNKLLLEGDVSEKDFPFHEIDSVTMGLLQRYGENGSTVYALSPAVELIHQGVLSQCSELMEEPPSAPSRRNGKSPVLEDDSTRETDEASGLIQAMMKRFPWIVDVKSHSTGLVSARSHLLPRTPDPSVHGICLSDGHRAVGLSVMTTAHTERQVTFVRWNLAEFLAERSRSCQPSKVGYCPGFFLT